MWAEFQASALGRLLRPILQGEFDIASSFWTILALPILGYAFLAFRKFVKRNSAYVIDGVLYAVARVATQRIAARVSLRRYSRLQLAGQTKYLNVPGVADINIPIDDIFIPLILENVGVRELYDHRTLFEAGNRIRIIGEPGSGKSSIAKKLLRDECQKALSGDRQARLAVLIELRKLEIPKGNKKTKDWLYNHISEVVTRNEVYEIAKCFSAYSTTVGLLVILDGLDEVSAKSYADIQMAINRLSERLSQLSEKNVVVLSMRTQYHQQVRKAYAQTYPTVLALKRFAPTDIYEFLRRWPFASAQKNANIVRIYNDLTDRASLREMCTNPLVLSMYVAQDQAAGYSIAPESRTDFYAKVTDELLVKRRAFQTGITEAISVLREERQRILGRIAYEHLLDGGQPANQISWKAGLDAVTSVADLHGDEAESHLRLVASETGLISEEREGESFRFIHLTFCEFFAAFEAAQQRANGWQRLVDKHQEFSSVETLNARLAEVLPFASALLPYHQRSASLADIAKCKDDQVLAPMFLETKLYGDELWMQFLERRQMQLLSRPEAQWDSDWLRELHLFLVVVTDAERSVRMRAGAADTDHVAKLFQQLSAQSATAIARLIGNYAQQDAAAAFRVATLCDVDVLSALPQIIVENSDQPPFLAIALEHATRQQEFETAWATLFAEAGLRSPAAAASLAERVERPWQARVRKIDKKDRFPAIDELRPSLYTDCLQIGLANAKVQATETPILYEVASLPFSKTRVVGFRSPVVVYFIGSIVAIFIASSVGVNQSDGMFATRGNIIATIAVALAYGLLFASIGTYSAYRHTYRKIFNVAAKTNTFAETLATWLFRPIGSLFSDFDKTGSVSRPLFPWWLLLVLRPSWVRQIESVIALKDALRRTSG
jgi:adenylate kinase family enzyme